MVSLLVFHPQSSQPNYLQQCHLASAEGRKEPVAPPTPPWPPRYGLLIPVRVLVLWFNAKWQSAKPSTNQLSNHQMSDLMLSNFHTHTYRRICIAVVKYSITCQLVYRIFMIYREILPPPIQRFNDTLKSLYRGYRYLMVNTKSGIHKYNGILIIV